MLYSYELANECFVHASVDQTIKWILKAIDDPVRIIIKSKYVRVIIKYK